MSRATYIAVAGNIGAGKSSFVDLLHHRFGIEPVFEPNDSNPFLADFYGDMRRWGFHSQIYFLAAKVQIHRNLRHTDAAIIQDRTLWEDAEIFAEHLGRTGVMSPREHETYRLFYESIRDDLRPPDLMVYLRCPVRVLRRRILQRGRAMEGALPASYLRALDTLYEAWFQRYELSPKIVFETDRLDPLTDIVDCHEVMCEIERYL
ncbi:MAG: deoxynucleoside kinase [Myxococcales bacterium]|nr:deoxynucleoside kinase [Myxococcales bacterium]